MLQSFDLFQILVAAPHPTPTNMLTIMTQSVGYSLTPLSSKAPARTRTAVMSFDQEAFIAESKEMRLKHLEEQVAAVGS